MKKRFNYGVFTFGMLAMMAVSVFLTSCGEDESTSCDAENIERLTNSLTEKTQEYATNPSVANCNAYKTAMNNFINATENCPEVSQSQISELKSLVSQLDCSQFSVE